MPRIVQARVCPVAAVLTKLYKHPRRVPVVRRWSSCARGTPGICPRHVKGYRRASATEGAKGGIGDLDLRALTLAGWEYHHADAER